MPDRRNHRGPHPEDERLFATERIRELGPAVADLAWLLSRGYPTDASLKLVGDRFGLAERQRTAVRRASCSDEQRARRAARRATDASLRDRPLWIDGFNVLVTVEAALGGGVLLACRDGCLRDMASMHGSFRRTAETDAALDLCAALVTGLAPSAARWLLDRPVSNSGRLAERIRARASDVPLPWSCDVVDDPDAVLRGAPPDTVVASCDSGVIDAAGCWFDLAGAAVRANRSTARVIRLDGALQSAADADA
ncbi:MAG: DUF434 domain-containing protein [Planctomycetes bacterium]|nr:DUF434 domain-containing protein [Planctomycetota bacterium]